MKLWERIRKERPDIADYVIHWTRGAHESGKPTTPFNTLIKIVQCGYLIAGFARKPSIYDRTGRPTVRGSYPAVCFTEQSLKHFALSCKTLPSNYKPYGVVLHKRALYQYGGRPVIYGSEDMLGRLITISESGYEEGKEVYRNGLPAEYQYLWVRYEPIPNVDGYAVDWTHEREWRCKVMIHHDLEFGLTPKEGIPILLPCIYDYQKHKLVRYFPKFLVSNQEEKDLLSELINSVSPEWAAKCQNKYLQNYFQLLPKMNIIVLSELSAYPDDFDLEWFVP